VYDLRYNYYALWIAILRNCGADTAFAKLYNEKARSVLSHTDVNERARLKTEGMTYREV